MKLFVFISQNCYEKKAIAFFVNSRKSIAASPPMWGATIVASVCAWLCFMHLVGYLSTSHLLVSCGFVLASYMLIELIVSPAICWLLDSQSRHMPAKKPAPSADFW